MSSFNNKNFLFYITLVTVPLIISLTYILIKELTLAISLIIVIILYFTKNIWLSNNHNKYKLKFLSLAGFITLALSNNFLNSLMAESLKNLSNNSFLKFMNISTDTFPFLFIITLYTILAIAINYFTSREKPILNKHPNKMQDTFKEKNFEEKLKSFCRSLEYDLIRIDKELNWNDSYFIPLEAEVEIKSNKIYRREITKLNSAIKKNKKDKAFLVLGDPGSGKSTSLRKLCFDLLGDVEKTNRVPIYVNLKEWIIDKKWDEDNPPTATELHTFIKENMINRLDNVCDTKFINQYFDRLLENGHLFLVLDSFDEIPAVLDEEDSSWLINELSKIIYKFLLNGHDSRGLLSSRIFRKPTNDFNVNISYEIKPLDDDKIIAIMRKRIDNKEDLIIKLFKEKPELLSLSRNPFSSALISLYIENHNKLPINQSQIYEDFINEQLNLSLSRPNVKKLDNNLIIDISKMIANRMYDNSIYGLEMPINLVYEELKDKYSEEDISLAINELKYSKIIRLGNGYNQLLSFVHRRFHEYFVAINLIDKDIEYMMLESIPKDTKWRDSLIMYCELSTEKKVVKIAKYCWNEIKKIENQNVNQGDEQYSRSIHCLRFLKEAFRSRRECLKDFELDLKVFLKEQIESKKGILHKKFTVEAVGLLSDNDIDEVITNVLNIKNMWIKEESFKSCRHLGSISKELSIKIKKYLFSIDSLTLVLKRKNIIFSLKVSNAFTSICKIIKLKILNIYIQVISSSILAILAPLYALTYILLIFICELVVKLLGFKIERNYELLFTIYATIAIILLNAPESNRVFLLDINSINLNYIIYLVVIILTFPWFEFFIKIQSFYSILKSITLKKFKEFLFKLSAFILIVIVGLFMIVGVGFIANKFTTIFLIIGSLSFLFLFIFLIYIRVHDYLILKKIKYTDIIERDTINASLQKFKTQWGQVRYVNKLDSLSCKFIGIWGNEVEYRCKNEEAETLLAKLDEKWLGLS
ncbi:NACHT domain-containing protein [Halarcobacter sp.]|uniref:NACHT domain-containing protein n=1 Tax=Halarcobacter sp. TaxID=2321133 RepID=UPI003A8E1D14